MATTYNWVINQLDTKPITINYIMVVATFGKLN